jgi:DNA-binding transcriptional LysR family regulator
MIPSPTDLHYFSEVAQTGNLSRAADRIGVTQPAVSLAINRLENSLGVILLMRTKNGVKLTRAGQKFAVEARALESEWERIRNEAKRDNTVASGRYTLNEFSALHHGIESRSYHKSRCIGGWDWNHPNESCRANQHLWIGSLSE